MTPAAAVATSVYLWASVVAKAPFAPRDGAGALVLNDRLYLIGGWNPRDKEHFPSICSNDVWSSADGLAWRLEKPNTYDTPQKPNRLMYNDVWSSPNGIHWTCHTAQAPWAVRQYHDVAVFDGRLWVLEGYGRTGNRNDVWCSKDGVNWEEVPGTPWKPRHAASLFVHRDALWIVTGNNMESDVWKLVKP